MSTDTAAIVRRANRADIESLGKLGARLVQEHYEFDRRRFLAAREGTADHYGAFLASQIEDPDVILLVAENEGRVIGYAFGAIEGYDYLSLRGPAGVVHDLIVEPGYRGRGVGRLLLNAMLSDLQSRPVPRVVLSTAKRNTSAQRLFERMGFRPTMIEMTRDFEETSR